MALETSGTRLVVENLGGFIGDLRSAQRATESFASSGATINRSLGTTNRAFSDAQRSAGGFGNTIASQARVAQSGFGTFVSSVTRGAGLVTGALLPLAAGAGLASFGQSIVSTRVTFERELANVGALARATSSEVELLGETALRLGSETSFGASQVLQGLQATSLAGFSVDDSITAIPAILDVAAAAGSELGQTSNFVTNALSSFGLAAEEAARVGDVMTAAFTGSNVTLESLASSLSFAAPGARDLGVSIEETSAAIGLLGNVGISGTRSGTAIRSFFNRLAAPVAEASDALDELGINAFNSQGQFIGLANVVEDFEVALAPLSDQARAEALNTIFGTVAATPFSALLGEGSEKLREFTGELENAAGTAEQVAGRQLDNLAGDLVILESATEGLSLALTRSLTPAFRGVVGGLTTGVTSATRFIEVLNDGGSTVEALATGLSSLNLAAFQFDDDLFQVELGDIFSGEIDFSSAIGRFSINDFIDGQLDLGVGDTTQRLRIGDLIDLSIVSADDFIQLDINEVVTGTYDVTSGFGTFNINDFIVGTFDFGVGDTTQRLQVGDVFDFSLITADDFAELNINDVITGTYDITSGFGTFNINDFIVGTFDFGVGNRFNSLTIGDFLEFTSEDVSSLFSDATANITKLTIGDFIDFTGTTGPAGSTINVNDVIIGTYDLANNITTIAISDLITGTLDLTTGQGSVTLGEDLTFEFDLSTLDTQIQSQLTSLQNSILGTSGGFEAGTFVPPTAGIASRIQDSINDALAGDFTFELPAIGSQLQLAVDTALGGEGLDFSSLSGGIDSLSESLSGLDEGLAGATGDDSTLASFVTLINDQIGGLATTLDSIDSTTVGESITGVITSLTGIFTQLNTIDDLAIGGIAGSLGDLTTSILGFATGLTAGLDADAIGEAAADSAATFISSFQAVFAEPDLPGIANAASGLLAGIGQQFATAFEPGNFTIVGASLGQLTTTIIDQLSATFSDPQFAADIGQGLADVLVGITQGLADVLDGFAAEAEGAGGELSSATTGFVANLISALASGLAEADYGPVVGALLEGIGGALTSLVPGLGGGIGGLDFAAQEIEAATGQALPEVQEFAVSDVIFDPVNVLDSFTGLFGGGVEVPVIPVPVESAGEPQVTVTSPIGGGGGGFGGFEALDDGLLTESVAVAAPSLDGLSSATTELATASEGATGVVGTLVNAVTGFFGVDGLSTESALQARRTGIGAGIAFDETDIASSVQDQILTQLNFGDLPDTVATAATDAIATAIPAESLIDSEIITTTLSEAVTAAIPAEPVIDADTVNETLLAAAQEAIPPSEIPSFPGWRQVLDFRAPRIPNFPSWRRVLNFRVPRIPSFPGWGRFINFDIPSIPAFPGWIALTGAVDLATLVPPFPGWEALIDVAITVPNISCELACSGGGGSGGGGGGGGGGGVEFAELQTGTRSFAGGLALVSEAGDEAIIPPRGEPFIARGEQLLDLQPGTQIIPAPETQRLRNGEMETIGGIDTSAPPTSSPVAALMQSPPSVTNITNNTRVENNFNLTTETLRSTEAVSNDFAMMERLASVSGVI